MCKEKLAIPVDRMVDTKRKMEGRGGEEAQGVADPKKISRCDCKTSFDNRN
jgi:hypothetical protein